MLIFMMYSRTFYALQNTPADKKHITSSFSPLLRLCRVLVLEDAVHGLVAAKAAGTFAVGITNTLPADHLEPHADRVIQSLAELDLSGM